MASSVFADKSRAVKSFRAARRCITLHTYIHPSYIYREQYSIQHNSKTRELALPYVLCVCSNNTLPTQTPQIKDVEINNLLEISKNPELDNNITI
ncbi:uncharacterized protein DFL_005819 [Arthrobotrys flagrans]|uniref:Uncharacterized protein n=1 Tax=Arthrobotrys flagrans TaxID=97331 RepID=A0A436ZYM0_ARTFL|nr:hypothetical protein DFL_005819 [Arthrobotrys flagrans]